MLFFSIIERSVLMALVFYCKGMLENITMQRTQQFATFVRYGTNPYGTNPHKMLTKLRPIVFAETCRFLAMQSLEFQEIWQIIAQMYREKSGF